MVKNPLAMQMIWVRPLGQKDALEKGMAAQPTPVFLPWKFHGKEAWQAIVQGVTKSEIWLSN